MLQTGTTPLHCAAHGEHIAIAQRLLRHNAAPDTTNHVTHFHTMIRSALYKSNSTSRHLHVYRVKTCTSITCTTPHNLVRTTGAHKKTRLVPQEGMTPIQIADDLGNTDMLQLFNAGPPPRYSPRVQTTPMRNLTRRVQRSPSQISQCCETCFTLCLQI